MPDARLRVLAAMDRDDRERAEEERREWDARVVVAKALLDGKRFVAAVSAAHVGLEDGDRRWLCLNMRTRTGWVRLSDGDLVPSNVSFNSLVYALSKKPPMIRVAEVR